MKDFEVFSQLKVPRNSKIIVRLDGRSFHQLSKDLNLIKPYDDDFYHVMANVGNDLFKEFSPLFIYIFSDEISILLDNIPFNGRVEKINSVLASFAASSFTLHYDVDFKKPVAFDSKIIPIQDFDVFNYFKWRQDESWRNCVNGFGIHYLKSKYSSKVANEKIKGLSLSDIHELLFENGFNLNDVDDWKKRGISIYKRQKEVNGFNKKENKSQTSYRSYIYTDWNTPIFTDEFFRVLLK